MKRASVWRAVAVGLACVVAGACGGEAVDEAGVARPPAGDATANEEPTTTSPTTSTPTERTPDEGTRGTSPPPVTRVPNTPAGREPVYVDGVPQVTATPSRAPAGTRVELEGYGFTGDPWQTPGGALWLSAIGAGDCYLMASADNDIRVSSDGHLTGGFVVPAKGQCRFTVDREMNTEGLDYHIAFQCTACRIGTFAVILHGESTEDPAGTACEEWVSFGSGENLAGDIYAEGLSCDEAYAFLRAHGGPLGPINGLAHIEAEGFACDRTGQSDVHLPRADYKCTRGSESIWFVRT